MSTEADTNNAGEQASPVPKTPKKKPVIAKDDNEAIADRLQRAIDCIPDGAKIKTQLYNNVVAHIRKANLRRAWVDTSLSKMFMGWSEFAEPNERPKLDYMIAAIAVYDMFGVEHQKFALEVTKRGLREWVNKKLEVPAPAATSSKPTAPEVPKIKTEPGSQSAELNKIRQSIEGGNGSTLPTGSKRPAPSESLEPANKRADFGTNQTLGTPKPTVPMPKLPQQPIIYREAGVQTDQSLALGEAREAMEKATARMERQTQVLEGHNAMFNELAGRTTITSTRPSVNHAHQALQFQGEAQEIFPVQYINRQQGPSSFYGRGQDPGASGGFFRF
ncbi:uncharacterized protein FIESC28_03996 [Fusarium coffeatum]|uniref:Uncharacterized protein n=1 Tax=Fusarium coffeatum TaxID=231269 RepID=A0A366S1T5_9HYPO|nr:uncharacterized protein FIESC28_03996 [Fusarium coffeatum]RBR23254.1 hypothetical protein FIESC28_03996 [Fusarium coffeatum]